VTQKLSSTVTPRPPTIGDVLIHLFILMGVVFIMWRQLNRGDVVIDTKWGVRMRLMSRIRWLNYVESAMMIKHSLP